MRNLEIAFITNFCPHYRVRPFERLAQIYNLTYYFFSEGDEWYWQKDHGVHTGLFQHEYLPIFQIGGKKIDLSLLQKLLKRKYDIYIKCINGKIPLLVTFLIAKIRKKPFILWTGIWTRLQTPMHRVFFFMTLVIYHASDAIVVYGDHVKNYLISENISPQKIFIAPQVIDNPRYRKNFSENEKQFLQKKLDIPAGKKVFLYLGRIEKSKGLEYLIESLRTVDEEVFLLVAGTGSEIHTLVGMNEKYGLTNRVRFCGYVPIEEAPLYYAIAWALILPSITTPSGKEPWGLVINEAFNQGLPVIVTDAVGAAAGGLVKNGVNGLVVRERSAESLGNAIQMLIKDPDQRDKFGQAAFEEINKWDTNRMVAGFKQAVEYVTSTNNG